MGSAEYSQRHATYVLAWHKLDWVWDTSYDSDQYSTPDNCVTEDPFLSKRVFSRDEGMEFQDTMLCPERIAGLSGLSSGTVSGFEKLLIEKACCFENTSILRCHQIRID
jgi:hypothetical protein